MVNRPKAIGTACETGIVRYLNPNGFGGAERIALHGTADQGDIGVCPGVMIESKGGKAAEEASDAQIASWLDDTERERLARGADVAALVLKRKGKGAANAGQWHAYLSGATFVSLATLADSRGRTEHLCLRPLPAVRITLAEFVNLLRAAGYGDPLDTERTAA